MIFVCVQNVLRFQMLIKEIVRLQRREKDKVEESELRECLKNKRTRVKQIIILWWFSVSGGKKLYGIIFNNISMENIYWIIKCIYFCYFVRWWVCVCVYGMRESTVHSWKSANIIQNFQLTMTFINLTMHALLYVHY